MMQQNLVEQKRRLTFMFKENLSTSQDYSQFQDQQLDIEELQMQGDIDKMEQIITERQEQLNHVEQFMTEINGISKRINTQVHEQRTDLVAIDQNVGTAKKNVIIAETNINDANQNQERSYNMIY